MGSGVSSPSLSSLTKEDVANIVESIGESYAKYKSVIIENEIDGSTIAHLNEQDLTEAFKELGIGVIHTAKIRSTFIKLSGSNNDVSSKSNSDEETQDKFLTQIQYFVFGSEEVFRNGLSGKVSTLSRSMEEECTLNDNGKGKADYLYVVYQNAYSCVIDSQYPHRIRDEGHDGMSLRDFANHTMAKKLTLAEVAGLRMYTGPFYVPWNTALRYQDKEPSLLEQWKTCISLLYSAVLKLSYLSKKGVVYRGVSESKLKIPKSFYETNGDNFAGGVELAFMSTTTDENVALEYARRGSDGGLQL